MTNPFDPVDPLPCIPDIISIPSFKWRVVSRATATLGANGYGAAILNPWQMAWSDTTVQNTGLRVSNGQNTWLAVTALPDPTTSPDWSAATSSSMFSGSSLVGGAQIRLVAAGLKCNYSGTTLEQSGRIVLVRQPGNSQLWGASHSTLLARPTSTQIPCTRATHFVTYYPDDPYFLGYHPLSAWDVGSSYQQSYSLGILFNGQPNQTYQIEAVAYFEVIGLNQPPSASQNDPVGYAAVLNATQSATLPGTSPQAWFQHALRNIGNAAVEGLSYTAKGAAAAASAAGVHYINNRARNYYNQQRLNL